MLLSELGSDVLHSVPPTSLSLRTTSGMRIGTTLAQLRKLGKVRVSKSTLGNEFTLAGVSGLVSSLRPTGKVTNLWSGLDCNFR